MLLEIVGCLSVRPRQNPLSALRDAMMVMRNGVEFLADYEVDPPQQCANNALNSDWTNAVGNAFYKFVVMCSFKLYSIFRVNFQFY
uniref:Uncharacterized protein n=1 Tax=Parascaris equorum TaxID=6256 RepID=A0A914R8W5_PAREQ